jgi:glycosyltransferase involved in cell wall biosynthesis
MKVFLVSEAKSIHTRRWAQSLKEAGHDIHVISLRNFNIPGIPVHQLPTFGLGRIGYLFAIPYLKYLHRKLKPDVVHAQHVTSYGFLCAIAGLKPLVVTAWGSDILISPKNSAILKFFVQYALKKCDRITTVASHMNPVILELGADEKKIYTIPFGVDLRVFYPRISSKKEGILKIISTRNFTPVYNIETLVSAMALVKKKGIDFELKLVGDGPLRPALEAQVESLKLSQNIIFVGYVEQSSLPILLSEADIFITSALSDGNNISLNEAMACATFPIATKIEANTQWINNNENGLLFEPTSAEELANAIEKAAFDKNLRLQAIEMNLAIVKEKANWEACVLKMQEVYRSLLG